MIAVVTGSNGFIGTHLVQALLEGGFDVRCLDLAQRDDASPPHPRIERYTLDCADPYALAETPALEGADYVFHLAGVTRRATLEAFRAGNVLPTANLLAVLQKAPPRRFVLVSSQAAAGPAEALERPKTEASAPEPVEAYGRSKLEAEHVVSVYADQIPSTIIRPCSVYGPRDIDFLLAFKQISRHLGIYAACRDKYISIIFVRDLVNGMLQAAQSPQAVGKTYFLCDDEPFRWRDVYGVMASVVGKRMVELNIPQVVVDLAGRAGDVYARLTGRHSLMNSQKIALSRSRYWLCSSRQARRDFGFVARVPLWEGMRMTYRWYVENGWLGARPVQRPGFLLGEQIEREIAN
jgi:nucleoside-diphosphate-sugar epimerase